MSTCRLLTRPGVDLLRNARAAGVIVRVRNGDAVIADLRIDGRPIHRWLAHLREEAEPHES